MKTKLDVYQKSDRKLMLGNLELVGGKVFYYANMGITIVMRPTFKGSKTLMVSVSIAASTEPKYSRKIGEFFALEHMNCGSFLTVPFCGDSRNPDQTWEEYAWGYAELLHKWRI